MDDDTAPIQVDTAGNARPSVPADFQDTCQINACSSLVIPTPSSATSLVRESTVERGIEDCTRQLVGWEMPTNTGTAIGVLVSRESRILFLDDGRYPENL